MELLLDTCTFLWIVTDAPELSGPARNLFQDRGNRIYLSAVSVWEIAVKHAMGRLELSGPPDKFIPATRTQHGIDSLPLDEEATLFLPRLPDLHRDPFDRMLVCQALSGGLTLLTPDENIARYPVQVLW